MFSLITIDLIIQPKCLIDEYAIIWRSDVWFNPPIAPIMILIMITVNVNVLILMQ